MKFAQSIEKGKSEPGCGFYRHLIEQPMLGS